MAGVSTLRGDSGLQRGTRVPHALLFAGVLVALAGGIIAVLQGGPLPAPAVACLLVGGTLAIAGAVSYLFVRATRRSFEWFVAWRYLRTRRGSYLALTIGGVIALIAIGLLVASRFVEQSALAELTGSTTKLQRQLQAGALLGFVIASWVLFFGLLLLSFSVFASISVFGVYLGTFALVVVLSVMGGFEHDLRRKILGTRAHVVVTRPEQMFSSYREALRKVNSLPEVRAVSPYVEAEVMISSQTNLSAALLRGIDPHRISKVTDLQAYMRTDGGAGSLKNLVQPERLTSIPAVPLLQRPDDRDEGPGLAADGGPARDGGEGGGGGAEDRPSAREAARTTSSDASDAPGSLRGSRGAGKERPREVGAASKPALPDGSDYRGTGPKVPPRPVYPGVIVGAELARNLRLYLGDDVNVIAPLGGMSPVGPIPKARPFRVAGIFYSGMYEFDTKYAYVTIPVARRFLGYDDEITGFEIKARDVAQAPALAERLRGSLGESYDVKDWQRLNRNLFSALKLEKIVMFIVLTFIVVVAAFAIIITLTMIVLEKIREIAALKALGASDWSLLKLFMSGGLYIGIIGMLVGVLEGIGVCVALAYVGLPLDPEVYYISQLPVRIDPYEVLAVAGAAVTLSFAATIHPALVAARLKPVEGLRFD